MSKPKAKYFYVYAVVNFEQRLAYIGSRGSVKPPEEDLYMGSYDKASRFTPLKKLILSNHSSRKEAFEAEREWQIKFNVSNSPLFVNKGIHTSSGFSTFGRKRPKEEMEGIKKALSKEVKLKNYKTQQIVEFNSYSEAAKAAKVSPSSIVAVVKGRQTIAGDYVMPATAEEQIKKALQKKSVAVKHIKTGEIFEFESYIKAANFIGVSAKCISHLVEGRIKFTGEFVRPDRNADFISKLGNSKQISLQNIKTREVAHFESLGAAARFLKCSSQSVSELAKGKSLRIKGYSLVGADLTKENRGGQNKKSIRIQNLLTNEISEFGSQRAAADFIGCAPSLVNRLANGGVRRVGEYSLAPNKDSPDSA